MTLLVTAPAAAAEDVLVQWTKGHTLDGLDGATSTTMPEECDEFLLLGAYGFAAWAYSTPAADNFRYQDGAQFAQVDDSMIAPEWRARGEHALDELPGAAGRLATQPGGAGGVHRSVERAAPGATLAPHRRGPRAVARNAVSAWG